MSDSSFGITVMKLYVMMVARDQMLETMFEAIGGEKFAKGWRDGTEHVDASIAAGIVDDLIAQAQELIGGEKNGGDGSGV